MTHCKYTSEAVMPVLVQFFVDEVGKLDEFLTFFEDIDELCVVRGLNVGQFPLPKRVYVSL